MEKIARIVSLEFESAELKKASQGKFRTAMNELAPGLELLAVINTDETSAMAIQIWPDQETLDDFEEKRTEWFRENIEMHIRDRIVYEGDLDFWFQQIKYFGANAASGSEPVT